MVSRVPCDQPPRAAVATPRSHREPTPIRGDLRPRALSDEELLAALRRGDGAVAGAFYDRLAPVIRHTLRRTLRRDSADLDDLVQVTFERILRAISEDRFRAESTLSTWAAAIAAHVAIDFLRRSFTERRVVSEFVPGVNPRAADQRLEARSEIQRVHEILSRMRPPHAEAVLLVDVLGHTLSELSELSGISLAAAQSRLHRGRQELLRRARALASPNPEMKGEA
jgi:RNA polymerase sigma-70 factor, ECF subfamily